MKNTIFLFSLVFLFHSCSTVTGKVDSELTVYGKWVLVEMSTSLVGSTTTGEDMYWQEEYMLNADGTFTKTRETDEETLEASGTYVLNDNTQDVQNDPNLILEVQFIYDEKSEIIGSCMPASLQEYTLIYKDLKMRNTWNACDGPGLEYEKRR